MHCPEFLHSWETDGDDGVQKVAVTVPMTMGYSRAIKGHSVCLKVQAVNVCCEI